MMNTKEGEMMKYRLSRKVKSDKDGKWLSNTVGDLSYILTVIELNLTHPDLKEYEYKVERED